MRALLFTNLVQRFLPPILKKLAARGVHVEDTLPIKGTPVSIPEHIDAVLMINEFASTPHHSLVRDLTLSAGKRLFVIDRQSARWPEELRGEGVSPLPVPEEDEPTTSRVEDLEGFLRTYIQLEEQGVPASQRVTNLRPFVPGGLRHTHQLTDLVYEILASSSCPDFFVEWWSAREVAAAQKPTEPLPPPPSPGEAVGLVTGPQDLVELANLYSSDAERYRKEIGSLKKEVDTLRLSVRDRDQQISLLRAERTAMAEQERSLRAEIDLLSGQVKALLEERTSLQQQMEYVKTTTKASRERLRALHAEIGAENEKLRARVAELEAQVPKNGKAAVLDALAPMKQLVTLGYLSPAEAFEKLAGPKK